MRRQRGAPRFSLAVATLGLLANGCALLGPTAIKGSRAAYNDAIVVTNNQQVLAMVVRMRYGEPSGLLAVSSVTANLNIQANVGSEFGFGPDSNYEGNLVPLSAGIAFEENPTISYTPVQGEKYLRQFLSPLPIDLTVLLLGALGSSPQVMTLLCSSINGIRNPDFLADDSPEPNPRFARIARLLAELNRGGHAAWAQEPGAPPSFALALSGEGAAYAQRLDELYGLLGFAPPRNLDRVVTLPVHLGFGKPDEEVIQLRTRSLWQLFQVAAASVEVPEEHLQSGLAPPLPQTGAAGRNIRIRGSKNRPRGAMIAVKHHGWWYSIGGTDAGSKLTFRILESLMSVRMAEAADQKSKPILTVPVSR
jgi:hypothetical protein